MVKCLECGVEVPVLQWTHFKYKCSGEITTIQEYKTKYPDAALMDDAYKNKTKITLENLIVKYGEEEGAIRWEQYRSKQALSNSLEYKKEKHGWSEEQYRKFNKSRAVTLENLIKKHGEVEGLVKWEQYCERQAFTNTLDYFIEREGSVEKGTEAYKAVNKEKAKVSDPHWIAEKYNISLDDALSVLSERKTCSFVSEGEKYFVDELEKKQGYEFPYSYKTKQFCLWSHDLNAPVFYDIADPSSKLIIEYYGDYWHANPKKYKPDDVIKQTGMTAKQIWERDQLKNLTAMKRGFTVEIVWESEWINDTRRTHNL